jgi:hypothetical protein
MPRDRDPYGPRLATLKRLVASISNTRNSDEILSSRAISAPNRERLDLQTPIPQGQSPM